MRCVSFFSAADNGTLLSYRWGEPVLRLKTGIPDSCGRSTLDRLKMMRKTIDAHGLQARRSGRFAVIGGPCAGLRQITVLSIG